MRRLAYPFGGSTPPNSSAPSIFAPMRSLRWVVAVGFGVSLLACAGSSTEALPEATPPPPPTLPYDRDFYALAQDARFSGSVLVAHPDTVFERSYRYADAPERMHTASNRRYPIGEIAQVLLRAAYFTLADQGRINLNAPIAEHVPELAGLRYGGQPARINYRMVLDHRAGLPEGLPAGERLGDLTLRSQPGIEEHYSALGYDLLARALAERMGNRVEEVIRINVLQPATMRNTDVFVPEAGEFGNRAVGFTDAGGALAEVPLGALEGRGLPGGLPEYYSTITDLFYLAQWLPESAYLRGAITQPAVRPGYRGLFYATADEERVAVVLSNFGGTDLAEVRRLVQK